MKKIIEGMKKHWKLLMQIFIYPIVGVVAVVMYWKLVVFLFTFVVSCRVTIYSSEPVCGGAYFLATITTILTLFFIGLFFYWVEEN